MLCDGVPLAISAQSTTVRAMTMTSTELPSPSNSEAFGVYVALCFSRAELAAPTARSLNEKALGTPATGVSDLKKLQKVTGTSRQISEPWLPSMAAYIQISLISSSRQHCSLFWGGRRLTIMIHRRSSEMQETFDGSHYVEV